MKRYKLLAMLVCASLVIIQSGCKRNLEEVVPQSSLNPDLIMTDPSAARTLYFSMYTTFRGYHGTLFQLGEMRSSLWVNGETVETENGGFAQLYTHDISKDRVPFGNWGGFYSLIYRINTVIDLIPKSTLPQADKDKMVAEAYGLRAYTYYVLLKTWGKVPITTEPTNSVGSVEALYRERSSEADVMALIKGDIEESLKLFGSNNALPSGKRVTWSRSATLTLKGDVYIWSGTHMNGGNADFTTAKTALTEVKNNPGLGLQANYADIFNPAKESGNKEIIFAISYEKDQAQNFVYNDFRVNVNARTNYVFDAPTAPVAVATAYPNVTGANRVGISRETLRELTSDARDIRVVPNSFRVMQNKTAPHDTVGVFLTKFVGTEASPQVYDTDFPIYRYADVLLLLAEAKAKLGEDPSAEINEIRKRGYGNIATYPVYTNGSLQQNMEAILEEYRREFIGEGKLWWALRRAGNSYVFAHIDPAYLSAATAYKLLLPISIGMMNLDPKLEQTEGYK